MKSLRAPLLLFVLPAVLVALAPGWPSALVLDCAAVGAGAVWQLWTGHWVHFSPAHAGWNLVVLLAAGTWLEQLRPGLLLRHTLWAAPLIGVAVLAGDRELQVYGGLSGLATGVVVLLGLRQLRTPGSCRWLWAGLLGLVAVKTGADLLRDQSFFARYEGSGVRAAPLAHFAGAVVAVAHYGLSRWVHRSAVVAVPAK